MSGPLKPVQGIGESIAQRLPEEWELARLKHLLASPLTYGTNEAADGDDRSLPRYIRITDIDERGNLKKDTYRSMPWSSAQPYLLKDQDILLARSGSIGKSYVYRSEVGPACFAGYLIRARVDHRKLLPEFLAFYLNSRPFWEYVQESSIQATIQNVSAEKYGNLPVSLPPLEEQRRIAAFLDHETARIDELVREQEILLSLLSQRWSGLVMAALTGQVKPNEKGAGEWQQVESKFWPERIPSNWVLAPLKRKLLRNDSGAWGAEPDSDEGYLTIVMRSTEQTIDGTWRLNHPAYRRLSSAERKATMLLEGDLLVTKSSGSQDHIGKTTLVDKEVANLEAGFSNFMQRLRFDRSVLPEFGWYLLNSDIARQQFAYLSTTTSGLANLNAEIIGGVVALFPPLEEQRSIVAFLNTALARNTELSLQTSRAIGHLLERRSALIGAAVTGQLDLSDWQRPEPGAVAEVA